MQNIGKVFADHFVAHIHTGNAQNGLGQTGGADQVGHHTAAGKLAAGHHQRNPQAGIVHGALVVVIAVEMGVPIAGHEVAAMIGKVNDNRILVDTHFLQPVHQPSQILVQRRALSQIVGVFFPVIAAQCLQILGRGEVRVLLFGADGAFIVVVVVLMVGFNMGDGHEERLLSPVLFQKFQGKVRDAVHTVAGEINAVVILVKHEAVIAVAGKFQNVTGTPEAGIAAPQLPGDGGDGMVDGGLLFQLPIGR